MNKTAEYSTRTKQIINLALFLFESYEQLTGEKLPGDVKEIKESIVKDYKGEREEDLKDNAGFIIKYALSGLYNFTFGIPQDNENNNITAHYNLTKMLDAILNIKDQIDKVEKDVNQIYYDNDKNDNILKLTIQNELLSEQIKIINRN